MCRVCFCVENTAVSGYSAQMRRAIAVGEELKPLCSEHFLGAWHGRFEKRLAVGHLEGIDGFLYTPDEAAGSMATQGPFTSITLPTSTSR